jgi:hypothetical protein
VRRHLGRLGVYLRWTSFAKVAIDLGSYTVTAP